MQQVLMLSFPFFALIFCGYAAARTRLLPLEAIPGLNVFVLYFALPCMLFKFGANTPITRLLDGSTFLIYLICAVLMVAITIVTTRKGSIGWNDASFGALVAAFPNTGFMGIPLITSLTGGRGIGPVVISLAVDFTVTTSLCVALSRVGRDGGGQSRVALLNVLKGVISNPLPWAIVLGGIWSYGGLSLFKPLRQIVDLLSDAGSPTALFTIGAVLAKPYVPKNPHDQKSGQADVFQIAFFKLILHPILVLIIGKLAIRMGLPLDSSSLTVLAIVAALPSASSIPMLTERYGAETRRIVHIVLITTALAFISFSTVVSLLL